MRLKNNNNLSYLLALALSAGCGVTYADSLNGNGSMQNWNPSSLVVDSNSPGIGTPYWNNTSGDGSQENVGWCLAGGGNCTMPAGTPGNIPYYGNGSSSASMMYFTSSGSPLTLTLQTLLTTQTTTVGGYDIFGYYIANGSGSAASASLVPVFNSTTDKVGSTAVIAGLTPGENYGFYIENIQGTGTQYATNYLYFMDSASNAANGSMPADSLQHFAAFTGGNGTYFLGDVDGDACQGNFQTGTSPCVPASQDDYNNLVVEMSPSASTPEPASAALLGGGLCLVGVLARRKKSPALEN